MSPFDNPHDATDVIVVDLTSTATSYAGTSPTALLTGEVGRTRGFVFIRTPYYTIDLPILEPPQKHWRWWHAFAPLRPHPARRIRPLPARDRTRRRQHPFPTLEAAARKRRRFLQEIRP